MLNKKLKSYIFKFTILKKFKKIKNNIITSRNLINYNNYVVNKNLKNGLTIEYFKQFCFIIL